MNSATSGLGFTLTNLFFRPQEGELDERLAEAVSVGGLRAAASNRVRALVLVRSTEAPPAPPAQPRARRRARVPLRATRAAPLLDGGTGEGGRRTIRGASRPLLRGWGGVHVAVNDLMEALRPQFLVWIDGLHKPGDVTLAPGAPAELRLAGAATPVSAADTRPSRPASPDAAE